MSPDKYKRKLVNEVIEFYKNALSSYTNCLNNEAKEISNKICIGDKIRTLCEKETFLTVKDHKEDFRSCPSFRLSHYSKYLRFTKGCHTNQLVTK